MVQKIYNIAFTRIQIVQPLIFDLGQVQFEYLVKAMLYILLVTSPWILVVYMMYYIVLCYIPQDTGCVYDVLHRSMLHPPWYWWYIWCTTSFYATFPMILVVYMVYYIVLCYIPQYTGAIHGEVYLSMLHPPGYWWWI